MVGKRNTKPTPRHQDRADGVSNLGGLGIHHRRCGHRGRNAANTHPGPEHRRLIQLPAPIRLPMNRTTPTTEPSTKCAYHDQRQVTELRQFGRTVERTQQYHASFEEEIAGRTPLAARTGILKTLTMTMPIN